AVSHQRSALCLQRVALQPVRALMSRPVLGVDHEVKARHGPVLHIGITERARDTGSATAAGSWTGAFPWAGLVSLAHPMGVIAIGTLGHHSLSHVAAPEYLRLPALHHNLTRMFGTAIA